MPDDFNIDDIAIVASLGGTFTGLDLLKAHVQRVGGETRTQQETMVEIVQDAITQERPAVIQAGTGTGKSLAYIAAAFASGKKTVIATATNQLSEQLINHDLPALDDTLQRTGKQLTYTLLKGRNNYLCKDRINDLKNLDKRAGGEEEVEPEGLFTQADNPELYKKPKPVKTQRKEAKETQTLMTWANRTGTGDRSQAPLVSEQIWSQVSVSQSDCIGRACGFYEECFTELARKRARAADIVVTNHALLAQEIRGRIASDNDGGSALLGSYDILIIDEAHAFVDTLTRALSQELNPTQIQKQLKKIYPYLPLALDGKNTVEETHELLEEINEQLLVQPSEPLMELPTDIRHNIVTLGLLLSDVEKKLQAAQLDATNTSKPKRAAKIETLLTQVMDVNTVLDAMKSLTSNQVRWVSKNKEETEAVLKVAPIELSEQFTVFREEKTIIATSATLAVGDDFTPFTRALGLEEDSIVYDVGTPFDYAKQGMLYIPSPSLFPAPVGKERKEHTEAVLDELVHLVKAAGGRTLALFTTTFASRQAATHLRNMFPSLTVLATGDAPADMLVEQFKEDETSVLCATMGMWQGVNVEGESCSLVVIDKVSFAPVDDVLTMARRRKVDEQGRDGFHEVIVAEAATSLAQGAGRLIRNTTDRGVVAILDTRILTKNYGKTLLASLPPFNLYHDLNVITAALERLTGGYIPQEGSPTKVGGRGGKPRTNYTSRAGGGKKKTYTPRRRSSTKKISNVRKNTNTK